jgi:hypothetical protein
MDKSERGGALSFTPLWATAMGTQIMLAPARSTCRLHQGSFVNFNLYRLTGVVCNRLTSSWRQCVTEMNALRFLADCG